MTLKTLMRRYPTEAAARRWLEEARWPEGPVCPRCGVEERSSAVRTRPGQYTCLECRYRYSVTSRTALHNTKLPLRTWFIAMYMITTSSKGISALKRADWLGVSYKTAWYVGHRIQAMMAAEPILLEGVVELDETYVGGKPRKVHRERLLPEDQRPRRKQGRATDKACVFVAVARGGRVIPRVVASHTKGALGGAVRASVCRDAVLVTDELPAYTGVGREYAAHRRVRHSDDEFARTDGELRVHVNTAESFNAMLKRAVVGVFHYVSAKHLHRYAIETAFRWNERANEVLERLAVLIRYSRFPLAYGRLTA